MPPWSCTTHSRPKCVIFWHNLISQASLMLEYNWPSPHWESSRPIMRHAETCLPSHRRKLRALNGPVIPVMFQGTWGTEAGVRGLAVLTCVRLCLLQLQKLLQEAAIVGKLVGDTGVMCIGNSRTKAWMRVSCRGNRVPRTGLVHWHSWPYTHRMFFCWREPDCSPKDVGGQWLCAGSTHVYSRPTPLLPWWK